MRKILSQMEESDDDSVDSEENNKDNNDNQIQEIEDIGDTDNASENDNTASKGSNKKHMKMLAPKKNKKRRKNIKKNDNHIVPMTNNATPDESNEMSDDGTQVTSTKRSDPKRNQKKLTPRKKGPSKKPNSKGKKKDDDDCEEPKTPVRSPAMINPVRSPAAVEDILESSPNENDEHELNEEADAPMRLEASGPIGGASAPAHNLLCEAYLNNMRDGVVHKDNQHNRNRSTVTLQLDEKFLSAKKPTMKEATDKKDKLLEANPQLNISAYAINTMMAFQFLTWFWTIITCEICGCIRMTMLSVANAMLRLIGQQRLNNFDDFQDYLETRNAMLKHANYLVRAIWALG